MLKREEVIEKLNIVIASLEGWGLFGIEVEQLKKVIEFLES